MLTLATWGKGIPFTLVSQDHAGRPRMSLLKSSLALPTCIYYWHFGQGTFTIKHQTATAVCNYAICHFPRILKTTRFSQTLEIRTYDFHVIQVLLMTEIFQDMTTLTTLCLRVLFPTATICQTSTRSLAVLVMGTATAQFPKANLSRYSQHLGRRTKLPKWCH